MFYDAACFTVIKSNVVFNSKPGIDIAPILR